MILAHSGILLIAMGGEVRDFSGGSQNFLGGGRGDQWSSNEYIGGSIENRLPINSQ